MPFDARRQRDEDLPQGNSKVYYLQVFLNLGGANPRLKQDGIAGPATRAAIFQVFSNRSAPAISLGEKQAICNRLGCTMPQLNAVSEVESSRGWDRSGLLTCLYERHYAWRWARIRVPLLSNPAPGGYTIDADNDGINDSWEKVADALLKWGQVAFEFASWGGFQIMGAWWDELGYKNPTDFVWGMTRSEAAHYEAFARYIEVFGLINALRAVSSVPADNVEFARRYNGPGYKRYDYHRKIAAAHRRHSAAA